MFLSVFSRAILVKYLNTVKNHKIPILSSFYDFESAVLIFCMEVL